MNLGYFSYPLPANEPVLNYAPGSAERTRLKEVLAELKSTEVDVPMYIGSKEIRTNKKVAMHPPHEHQHVLGYFHAGEEKHVHQAIEAALAAKEAWSNMDWENRDEYILKKRLICWLQNIVLT
jgi:1-pyrroline-5-carboxylate dehydrogenase